MAGLCEGGSEPPGILRYHVELKTRVRTPVPERIFLRSADDASFLDGKSHVLRSNMRLWLVLLLSVLIMSGLARSAKLPMKRDADKDDKDDKNDASGDNGDDKDKNDDDDDDNDDKKDDDGDGDDDGDDDDDDDDDDDNGARYLVPMAPVVFLATTSLRVLG
ncbi:hypothetical protein ANN_18221 [Periplaneta americana]|uniref:Uncharacterized protein n=2 Tax=Periplaneta americana TaxID=6978 RepID=A0ABQ8SPE7_PERAM|nr:hypothetical protein ANN_18221 [Periplaneta americana]